MSSPCPRRIWLRVCPPSSLNLEGAERGAKAVLRGITAAPWGKKTTFALLRGKLRGGSDGDQTSMISHVQWLHMFLLFFLSFKWIKCAFSSLFNLSIGFEDLENEILMNIHKFYELI